MSTTLAPLPNLNSDSLDQYLKMINQYPLLSNEEEQSLARRLQKQQDLAAAQGLITSHLRFVAKIARGYKGYGLPISDLIQEGNIGLMKAVKRFDPEQGVRLVSFAVHWIRAEIHEYILRNWRIVKVATTKPQRKLFFNLRNSKKRLGWFSREEVESVAKDLDVKPETVLEMESRLSGQDITFDPIIDNDEDTSSPHYFLTTDIASPEQQAIADDCESMQSAGLHSALADLDQRSSIILQRRWLDDKKATLHELADEFGVSAERIRQLEKNAMKKMKSNITQH